MLKEAKVASVRLSLVVLDIFACWWKYGVAVALGLGPRDEGAVGAAAAALVLELFCLLRGFALLCLSTSITAVEILPHPDRSVFGARK